MLDILKSEGNFVIKFVALTIKLYIYVHCNYLKRGPQTYNNGIIHAHSSDHLKVCKRKLRCPHSFLSTNTQWDHK